VPPRDPPPPTTSVGQTLPGFPVFKRHCRGREPEQPLHPAPSDRELSTDAFRRDVWPTNCLAEPQKGRPPKEPFWTTFMLRLFSEMIGILSGNVPFGTLLPPPPRLFRPQLPSFRLTIYAGSCILHASPFPGAAAVPGAPPSAARLAVSAPGVFPGMGDMGMPTEA